MAIYIQLNRIDDGKDLAVYEFGPVDRIVGTVAVDKRTGDVEIIEFSSDAPQVAEFYLPRIRRILLSHREEGEYPVETSYRA